MADETNLNPSSIYSRWPDRIDELLNSKGYTHPQLLFTPTQLFTRLKDPRLCLIDVRLSHEFARGHIPGAIHFDLYGISLIDTGPEASRAFMWMYQYLLQHRGIDFDKTVVFYENISGMKAARAFWFLEYFGHEDVHVLDGGLNAWVAAGYPVTTEVTEPKVSHFQARPKPELFWNAEEVLKHLHDPDTVILDTRSDEEYYARNIRAARGGAIPGAVHLEWTRNLDEKGAFKPAHELKAMYEAAGVTPDKDIVSYCQGGYRSSHAYLALRLIGYPKLHNYIGSWKEWGDRLDLPIEIPKP